MPPRRFRHFFRWLRGALTVLYTMVCRAGRCAAFLRGARGVGLCCVGDVWLCACFGPVAACRPPLCPRFPGRIFTRVPLSASHADGSARYGQHHPCRACCLHALCGIGPHRLGAHTGHILHPFCFLVSFLINFTALCCSSHTSPVMCCFICHRFYKLHR